VTKKNRIRSQRPDHLLIPLDGSRAAERAVPIACVLAQHLQTPVTIVHVFESVKELASFALDDINWSARAEPRAVVRPPAALRESVAKLEQAYLNVQIIGRVGNAAEEIIREAVETPGSWVVMTSLGSSGMSRLILGSVARSVVRAAVCPVVLVPNGVPKTPTDEQSSLSRISVFLDGAEDAEITICAAAGIAEAFDAQIELVRVAETMVDDTDASDPEALKWETPVRAEVEHYLGSVAGACSALKAPVKTVTLAGNASVQVLRYVDRASPDIVGLAVRKRSGIERWTYGSLSEKLLDKLTVPLLLVPTRSDED
jgi:nucleotide-binding universal stress UspA family protein